MRFNLKKVIDFYKIDTAELSKRMFPEHFHKATAMKRLISGETEMSVKQLEVLADFIGVSESDLLHNDAEWKGGSEDGCLTLLKGPYKVKLNYGGVQLLVYKDSGLIIKMLTGIPDMPMKDFIDYLNNLINTYENGTNQIRC
jgi:hypothetical protein